ncbi:hypothetical protein LINGRAHAP2_LOCUS11476 [Linum grandiflorum]
MINADDNSSQRRPSSPISYASLLSGGGVVRQSSISRAEPGDIQLTVRDGARFLETSTLFRNKLCEPLKQTISTDYLHALSGGPWTILGHYLAAFAWDPTFRVTDDLSPWMVVWIRFPRLPYQYYHHDVLVGLGNLVGKSVRPDISTQNSVRGKFARIAVEVNLAEPLPKGVFVDGVWLIVEYENLPSFCT